MVDLLKDVSVPSDSVLDSAPARALRFFGAVSTNPQIRATLARRGYTQAIHDEAWALVLKASGYRRSLEPSPARSDAAAAVAELDAWDEPNFRIARAALLVMPEQSSFIFDGLTAQKGIASVVSVKTFLDRLVALETSEDRIATRQRDLEAIEKLANRGYHTTERARLRKLIAVATDRDEEDNGPPSEEEAQAEALANERRQAKVALWAHLTEWSEIAKTEIRRRDYLIQLGLAKRKSAKKANETVGADADSAPVSVE